ncbi:MAG: GSCFA domain-containing protein [Phycisphaerales bacterium]|nr:GSCFA domain-containing protein [Phycisphaerae bacterium]NNF43088.1 GSCFA domain-containing protein [Phycisphaerales bacterium]NNM27077.1 GSCFA domain-containing protein [Phycisphaerales bacterium]
MYAYNPDRRGLSEVKLLKLEPWRLYPRGDDLATGFLAPPPSGETSGVRITRQTPIASIGSCFAREIKHWLQANGYAFIETATGPCTQAGSARYDRVYNTFTLRQEFERAFGVFEPVEDRWDFIDEDGKRRLLDPHRKGVAWESEEEMAAELAEHKANVRQAFSTADILIMTIGQAEIWYHRADGSVYPLVPPVQVYDPASHAFRMTTYEENLANLERVFDLFTANNGGGHVIITVSPVPLRATFRPMNSLIANTATKSMLRAVVDAFVTAHPDRVTYFPAYEIITLTEPDAYEDDNRHVRPVAVDHIMKLFERWFVAPAPTPAEPSSSSA